MPEALQETDKTVLIYSACDHASSTWESLEKMEVTHTQLSVRRCDYCGEILETEEAPADLDKSTPDEATPDEATPDEEERVNNVDIGSFGSVYLYDSKNYQRYRFVTKNDMMIEFSSKTSQNVYGILYNVQYNVLAYDNGEEGTGFRIKYDVTAGKTYYLETGFVDADQKGEYGFGLEQTEKGEPLKKGYNALIYQGGTGKAEYYYRDYSYDYFSVRISDMTGIESVTIEDAYSGELFRVNEPIRAEGMIRVKLTFNEADKPLDFDVEIADWSATVLQKGSNSTAHKEGLRKAVYAYTPQESGYAVVSVPAQTGIEKGLVTCGYDEYDVDRPFYAQAGETYYVAVTYRNNASDFVYLINVADYCYPQLIVGTNTVSKDDGEPANGYVSFLYQFIPRQDGEYVFLLPGADNVSARVLHDGSEVAGVEQSVNVIAGDDKWYFLVIYQEDECPDSFDIVITKTSQTEIKAGETKHASAEDGYVQYQFASDKPMFLNLTMSMKDNGKAAYRVKHHYWLFSGKLNTAETVTKTVLVEPKTTYTFGIWVESGSGVDLSLTEKTEFETMTESKSIKAKLEGGLAAYRFIPSQDDAYSLSCDCIHSQVHAKVYDSELNSLYDSNYPGIYYCHAGENYYICLDTSGFSDAVDAVLRIDKCAEEDILGDVDGNRRIEIRDATFLQRKLAGCMSSDFPFDFNEGRADSDEDGVLTPMDVTCLQMYLAKMDVFPYRIGDIAFW